jgi:hypothetical protein
VVTAPTPSKEVLGYPARTPAANRVLSRNVRDKVEEVEEQPKLVFSSATDPHTPAPTRQKIQETPPPQKVESPLLPVLRPDIEDVRDTSMLTLVNGRELESPVPVEIAAMVPLPDEVDEVMKESASLEREIGILEEPAPLVDEGSALEPAFIEAISEPIIPVNEEISDPVSTVDEPMSEPEPTVDDVIDEPESAVKEIPLPTILMDQSTSVTATTVDETISGAVSAVEETPIPTLPLGQATSITEIEIDETIAEPVSAVEAVTVTAPSPGESSKPVSTADESIHFPSTADDATDVSESTMDELNHVIHSAAKSGYVKVSLKNENPVKIPSEEPKSTTSPSVIEKNTDSPVPDVTEHTVIEEVELGPAPAIAIDIPASPANDVQTIPQSRIPATLPTTVESETKIEPHDQAAASEIVEVEGAEDLPAAPALTQIAEDLPAASASIQTAKRVNPPVPDVQVQQSTPSESEIDTAVQAASSSPLLAQLPISPEQTSDQVDATLPSVQPLPKGPSETKTNPVTRAPSRSANTVTRAPSRSAQSRPPVKAAQTVKATSTTAAAPAPPRKPPVPRAAAISRPNKPVERKTFRPVTAAQTAAAASLAKVRSAQAVAQAEAAKPRVPSATISKPAVVEPRSRVASAGSSSSHGAPAASTKSSTTTTTAPTPAVKTTQSRLLAPTKASASRAATIVSHPSTKPTTSAIASNPALPPVRKEKIKLKAALPSFRPVGPGTGTWIASSTSKPVPRAAAIPLPHSPVLTKSVAKPETIALPPSPIHRTATMALPDSPASGASRTVKAMQPASLPLPASPTPVAAEVPLPDSPISQAGQFRSRVNRAASPAISALQARLATPSRNSSAPTMSDQDSDSEGEDESSGVTFKGKSNGRPQSGMKMKMKLKQIGTGDLMEFSAPARMEKVWIGSTTPMYTPGRKALVIRDANLASPLVRKVVNEE